MQKGGKERRKKVLTHCSCCKKTRNLETRRSWEPFSPKENFTLEEEKKKEKKKFLINFT